MRSLYARLRQLILPTGAKPNDPAIIVGPDLPPCMATVYAAAIFLRPPNTASSGINGSPWWFIAQRTSTGAHKQTVDEGFLIYDQSTVCGYVVCRTRFADNNPGGTPFVAETMGDNSSGGVASISPSYNIQIGSSALRAPTTLQIGLPIAGLSPIQSEFLIDNVSAPRGLRSHASSAGPSAAIGAEAVVLTLPAMTFFAGRCYNVVCEFDAVSSVANSLGANIRQTNLAGTQLLAIAKPMPAGGAIEHVLFTGKIRRLPGTDLTDNLVHTISASAGTVTARGTGVEVRYCEVWDCGSFDKFPNAITI